MISKIFYLRAVFKHSMSSKEIVSAAKYVSRMKPEFMLSELRDYVKGDVSLADVFKALEPVAPDLDIRLEPTEGDYKAVRLSPVKAITLNGQELSAQKDYFEAPAVPEKLERLIEGYIHKKTGKAWDDPAVVEKLRKAIVEQKAEYWKEGRKRRITYGTGYRILGYLAYQFPVYFVQSGHIINELATGGLLKDRMKVLDAGTGPGTVPLALIDFYRRIGRGEAVIRSLEKYDENIEAFNALVPAYAEGTGVKAERPLKADLQHLKADDIPDNIDLMFFSNVLNELSGSIERKAEIVRAMADRLAKDGSIVIVEPADKANSTEMRKLILTLMNKGLGVYSPCSFIWCVRCHPESCWTFQEKEDIRPTRLMEKVAEEERFRFMNTDIKYSYAVLRHDKLSREKYRVPEKAKFARLSKMKDHVTKHINVVGAVMSGDLGDEKDHVFKLCDGTSVKPVYAVLPDYHVAPGNQALMKADYGKIVEIYGVLVRYNKENDAYNLLVTRNTMVKDVDVQRPEA
jgi:SAM-dependent methyltransferase